MWRNVRAGGIGFWELFFGWANVPSAENGYAHGAELSTASVPNNGDESTVSSIEFFWIWSLELSLVSGLGANRLSCFD